MIFLFVSLYVNVDVHWSLNVNGRRRSDLDCVIFALSRILMHHTILGVLVLYIEIVYRFLKFENLEHFYASHLLRTILFISYFIFCYEFNKLIPEKADHKFITENSIFFNER